MSDHSEAMDEPETVCVTGEPAGPATLPTDSAPPTTADFQNLIDTLTATLAERDSEVAGLRAGIGDLTATLAERDSEIAGVRAGIGDLTATLAERNGEVAGLRAGIGEQARAINALQEELLCAAGLRSTLEALTATLADRDQDLTDLRTAAADRDQQIVALQKDVEHGTTLQRSLEAEFDQARRQHRQTSAALAAARDEAATLRDELAARDALIGTLQNEAARRGPAGSRAAVSTALGDLLRNAQQRRLERLAATQPWRLPPKPHR